MSIKFSVVLRLFLSNGGALIAQINDLHFFHLLKQRTFTKTLASVTNAC